MTTKPPESLIVFAEGLAALGAIVLGIVVSIVYAGVHEYMAATEPDDEPEGDDAEEEAEEAEEEAEDAEEEAEEAEEDDDKPQNLRPSPRPRLLPIA